LVIVNSFSISEDKAKVFVTTGTRQFIWCMAQSMAAP